MAQVTQHLAENNIEIAPRILIHDGQGQGNGLIDALLGTEIFKHNFEMFKKTKNTDAASSTNDAAKSGGGIKIDAGSPDSDKIFIN